MIVALDAQLALGTATGIGEYVVGLAHALRDRGVGVIELQEPKLDPWRFDRRVVWDQVLLPQRARAAHADVLHCASGTMPLHTGMPAVVTVHDVAWLRVQAHARPYARYYFGTFALHRYPHAAAIAVDSSFSRDELLDVLALAPDRVHVVYPGVASDYRSIVRNAVPQPVVLVPGTVERRKNLEVLIRALRVIPDARVVSVGPPTPYRDECERLAKEHGVAERVEFRGYVERNVLLELYATCALVAVPSHYEGFGYAAAQALCAGTPVVVSDKSSLPEVAGGDAAIVPAEDETAWAREIAAILQNPRSAQQHADAARSRAIERFSWNAAAAQMQQIYESIV